MRKSIFCGLFAATLLATSAGARAQDSNAVEASALGECFVAKSTGEDRIALVRWIAGAMLASPKLSDLAHVDAQKNDQAQQQIAVILTRLMTKDCLAQTRAVAKTGNASAGFEIAGSVLGKMAVKELFSDPAASAAVSGFSRYLKPDDFKVLEVK